MSKLENTTEHQIDISAGGKTVSVPRGHGGDEGKQNGSVEVDDAFLTEARKDPIVKAWFDSGDLVMKGSRREEHDMKESQRLSEADAKKGQHPK